MLGDLVDDGVDVVEVCHVEVPGLCGTAVRNDFGGDGLCASRNEIRHRNVCAFGREYPRGGAAHAAGCAGDENRQSGDRPAELFEIRH